MDPRLLEAIKNLCASGCQGNSEDFSSWVAFEIQTRHTFAEIESALAQLESEGEIAQHGEIQGEFLLSGVPDLPTLVSYKVSGDIKDSPIQLVRSRLDAFLRKHQISEEVIIDLSIGTTEAMENAVKYSDHEQISVFYEITPERVFSIKIVNSLDEIAPEKDIASGKYSGTATLMRGMMIMVKLFDEMDIDIKDDDNVAVFTATRKI